LIGAHEAAKYAEALALQPITPNSRRPLGVWEDNKSIGAVVCLGAQTGISLGSTN
jgi:hypothetical protein